MINCSLNLFVYAVFSKYCQCICDEMGDSTDVICYKLNKHIISLSGGSRIFLTGRQLLKWGW